MAHNVLAELDRKIEVKVYEIRLVIEGTMSPNLACPREVFSLVVVKANREINWRTTRLTAKAKRLYIAI
ncbi:hypothetical protein PQR39_10245 [Paraburkholderia sediminicola]|uniref:hypothetical protein n=1 Tax=Paraburkholderia sediminicola TaxID=458836 RepID=UPI0038B80E45